jgi:hypothetical protein
MVAAVRFSPPAIVCRSRLCSTVANGKTVRLWAFALTMADYAVRDVWVDS